ncbi:helix-turn-helix domain-containing protein [Paludibacterium purpuratum]|uniref:Xre family transcriptional regulator n=1 Tax=Paludibacterium purpuratum TaxID=1144873 RepID=A0A4R7BGX9_9NEIS|nr:helix-turn-helix domain-containing protein [Paludibacterium purpuratum]TDR82986.1 Xre family transcriptional regulator [Paludibacterium purpuratum]
MSTLFDSIKQGLNEAIAHQQGRPADTVVHQLAPLDVKAIRAQTGLTQQAFAARFGVSLGTLRHWERGDRQPHGPARVLMLVIAKNPEAVLSVLSS